MSTSLPDNGYPIVLTADRTLMAAHRTVFDGMTAAAQTTVTPGFVMRSLLAPRMPALDGARARFAPLGLRRIEAALVEGGFAPEDVAAVSPERLGDAVGAQTRVVGVSSGDPLGLGMNSGTMEGIGGGRSYPSVWFKKLMRALRRLRRRHAGFRVVMGGPGAWQLAQDAAAREELGVDCVLTGYAEGDVADLFAAIAEGRDAPDVWGAKPASPVPRIRGGTVMGAVEISRGCGRGCGFCAIRNEPMRHLPTDAILADIETNLAAGAVNPAAISEDFFRYGAEGSAWAAPDALLSLLRDARRLEGVRMIQIDHANVASVAHTPDDALGDIRDLLAGDSGLKRPWLNLGVETVNGALLEESGGLGKIRPFRPDEWGEVALEQTNRLIRAGYFPMVSLILGLPGETEADVEVAAKWVARLPAEPVSVFPLFLAPMSAEETSFDTRSMTAAHWRLMRRCYRLNFKWIPRALWDNQAAGGETFRRRAVLRLLGYGQVATWKTLLAARSKFPARPDPCGMAERAS